MTTNAIQSSHMYSTYFAPRGRSRIYTRKSSAASDVYKRQWNVSCGPSFRPCERGFQPGAQNPV